MKFKTDENLPAEATSILIQHGHDAMSVHDQRLAGHPDDDIAKVCRAEERAIVTLDLDFSDIRVFPPGDYFGIMILRPEAPSISRIEQLLLRALAALQTQSITGQLWIVEEHRVRIRQ
jgi:predicted nuclease of predicted toxin-antitoxin system